MSTVNTVAFFDTKPYDREVFNTVLTEHQYGDDISISYFESRLSEENAIVASGFPVVCAFVNDYISKETVDALYAGGTRLIALRCAGYNNIDLASLYGRMHVVRVPAYSPYAVAEHTVTLILSLNRKTHRAYYRTRDRNFTLNGLMGFDMHGKTVGIIGTGKIGRITAEILKGFGMKVLVFDPYPQQQWANDKGAHYVDLNELYRESDIVSLHCPLTKENTYMINQDSIAKMKHGVFIINTGRGKLIDTKALIDGLKKGTVGAAGLDVYEEETEYFFEDFSSETILDDTLARLLTFPNVLITSHQAFFTREALTNIAGTTLNNIAAFLNNQPLDNEICYRCDKADCRKKEKGRCF